jgi:hypothetical protein
MTNAILQHPGLNARSGLEYGPVQVCGRLKATSNDEVIKNVCEIHPIFMAIPAANSGALQLLESLPLPYSTFSYMPLQTAH